MKMIINCITAGSPLTSFGEALWFGVQTNANIDPLSCHHTFEAPYVYQAVVNVDDILPTKLTIAALVGQESVVAIMSF